jgi:DNA anti-recombination protein RmuC
MAPASKLRAPAPNYVVATTVCFVPAEDLLSAAYNERPELFYDAMRQRVLIATPTTLVALLWGVAYGWQQDARVRQAQQIGDTAAELHRRFGILMQHLHKTGRSLNTAVNAHNALVSSLDSKILPQLRKLEDLGILGPGTHLPDAQAIPAQTRLVPNASGFAGGESPDGETGAEEALGQLTASTTGPVSTRPLSGRNER